MNKKHEELTLAIPVILVQENDNFIVSCDTLGVYAQSKTQEGASEGFRRSLELFFNSLDKRRDLIDFLYEKNIIEHPVEKLTIHKDFKAPKLKLGHYTNIQVPAYA
jgi:hypothetical protein